MGSARIESIQVNWIRFSHLILAGLEKEEEIMATWYLQTGKIHRFSFFVLECEQVRTNTGDESIDYPDRLLIRAIL